MKWLPLSLFVAWAQSSDGVLAHTRGAARRLRLSEVSHSAQNRTGHYGDAVSGHSTRQAFLQRRTEVGLIVDGQHHRHRKHHRNRGRHAHRRGHGVPRHVALTHVKHQLHGSRPKLMDMIDTFRAEKCAQMHDDHGARFGSFDACMDFMKAACNPGKDRMMDGDTNEVTTGQGFCQEFFPTTTPAPPEAPAPAPAAAPAPAPAPADSDGDGAPDHKDAFPHDAAEILDSDKDGIGDNADKDLDNDGVENDKDAFPKDPKEHEDTDGDGVGDNADPDDDGDGVLDEKDAFPKDSKEHTDTDGDGIGDNADPDDDGDGVLDEKDAFPKDASEHEDTDGDGMGDNKDPDDDNDGAPDEEDAYPKDPNRKDRDTDNDGVPDKKDAFPKDPTEHSDKDGDGIGDNADTDDDNDGVPDDKDAFPLDPSEHEDTDGDGIGDNADPDDDNDGWPDEKDAYPKDPTRSRRNKFHMTEKEGAKEQGFSGAKVEHDDMKTSTDDWQSEYGPRSSTLTNKAIRKICSENFSIINPWCFQHGYLEKNSAAAFGRGAPIVTLLAMLLPFAGTMAWAR